HFNRKQIWKFSGYGLLLLMVIGGIGHAMRGFPERLTEQQRAIYDAGREKNPRGKACSDFNPDEGLRYQRCVPVGEFEGRVLITGDSHAAALVKAMDRELNPQRIAVTQFTNSGCQPIGGVSRDGSPDDCS